MTHWNYLARIIVIGTLILLPGAFATTLNLSDANSSIKTTSQSSDIPFGINTWTIDGEDQLFSHWFYYRIGDTGGERPISSLTQIDASSTPNSANITYELSGIFSLNVDFTLLGGSPGSHWSQLNDVMHITNLTGAPLDLHFFQYFDFDLGGTDQNNGADFDSARTTVRQFGAEYSVRHTAADSDNLPSLYETGFYSALFNSLNDGCPTTLNNNPSLGAGDATFALQWDTNIAGGESALIQTQTTMEGAVPEPMTFLLVGAGLFGLSQIQRRRKRA